MSFIESPRFPEDINYGATGGPTFSTDVIVVKSGGEKRNKNWSDPLYKFECAHGVKTQAQLNDLIRFFMTTKGRANGFRFKDWSDFTVAEDESHLELNGNNVLQLYKKYELVGNTQYNRKIIKTVASTFKLYRNSVLDANVTIDDTTGIITLTNAIKSFNVVSISKAVNAEITFDSNHTFVGGEKIKLSEIVGMTQLNNQVATVSVVDADTITINIDSTAYTTYISGGKVKQYYNSSDVIEFTVEFDIPARFDTDELYASIDNYNIYSWGQIPIVELRVI